MLSEVKINTRSDWVIFYGFLRNATKAYLFESLSIDLVRAIINKKIDLFLDDFFVNLFEIGYAYPLYFLKEKEFWLDVMNNYLLVSY